MPRKREYEAPGANGALEGFKWEIAEDLGLAEKVRQVGWENMTTREVGMIGGQMVRRMIQAAEESLRSATRHPRADLAERLYENPHATAGLSDLQALAQPDHRPPKAGEGATPPGST